MREVVLCSWLWRRFSAEWYTEIRREENERGERKVGGTGWQSGEEKERVKGEMEKGRKL